MSVRKLTFTALFAAVTCLCTVVFIIPLPFGYVNMGDVTVLLSAVLLGPFAGAVSAGLGSALADIFAGFGVYAPATLVIKALMAVVCYYAVRSLCAVGLPKILAHILAALLAETVMVFGYFAYESFLYGVAGAAGSIPWNAMQGGFAIIVFCTLSSFLPERVKNYFGKTLDKKTL